MEEAMRSALLCRISLTVILILMVLFPAIGYSQAIEYKVLATTRTSTMEKELNQAANSGFRLEATMGGEAASAGAEAMAIMSRPIGKESKPKYEYRLLATSLTSTMQKELQMAGDAGYVYKAQTVYKSAFGGREVVIILERDKDAPIQRYEYKLLATSRTSTIEKELQEAGASGYGLVGMAIGKTAVGGQEVICILRKLGNR
jgi:hypothetical protein